MDIGLHQLAQGCVDTPVPGQRRIAGEDRTDDADREVAAAVARALMPDVLMAFIDDVQTRRRQCSLQARPRPMMPLLTASTG